jgi:hypothetical protein
MGARQRDQASSHHQSEGRRAADYFARAACHATRSTAVVHPHAHAHRLELFTVHVLTTQQSASPAGHPAAACAAMGVGGMWHAHARTHACEHARHALMRLCMRPISPGSQ